MSLRKRKKPKMLIMMRFFVSDTFYKGRRILEMQEANIEKFLKKCVEDSGGLCLKFVSPSMAGVPDRIVLLPHGKIFFVELKAPGKKAKPHQERLHTVFKNLGATVYVADSKEKVREIMSNEIYTAQLSKDGN